MSVWLKYLSMCKVAVMSNSHHTMSDPTVARPVNLCHAGRWAVWRTWLAFQRVVQMKKDLDGWDKETLNTTRQERRQDTDIESNILSFCTKSIRLVDSFIIFGKFCYLIFFSFMICTLSIVSLDISLYFFSFCFQNANVAAGCKYTLSYNMSK